ncbi:MAG TPA: AmmeMemoRadiSam system protein B [Candidatus Hydrogenedentes bacterium]|nr:AmmeMemoRadiSam system protein B [Candidatus Hydrogenedentota bacterium]HPG69306.1 AmmeMemoRadiSam system protein B [Candidatus Hydrogenedentota bacterium]
MRTRFIAVVLVAALLVIGAQVVTRIRKPAVAGVWYPAERRDLQDAIHQYVENAQAAEPPGRIVACIVPCSPYGLSGELAGPVYKLIKTGQYDRVIVLTPSHFAAFPGCSIAAVHAYETPLGQVLVDGPSVRKVTYSSFISTRSVRYSDVRDRVPLHEVEYGIEVVLPFLQERIGIFTLIPVVVGDLVTHSGAIDDYAIDTVSDRLREVMDDRTLVIVSSDLTHHGNTYSYRPFRDNVLEGVERFDKDALRYVLAKAPQEFKEHLEKTANTIYGKAAILIMLGLLPPEAQGQLLAYDITARKTGDLTNAIGMASVIFFDPTQPPCESHPDRAIPQPQPQPPSAEEAPAEPEVPKPK